DARRRGSFGLVLVVGFGDHIAKVFRLLYNIVRHALALLKPPAPVFAPHLPSDDLAGIGRFIVSADTAMIGFGGRVLVPHRCLGNLVVLNGALDIAAQPVSHQTPVSRDQRRPWPRRGSRAMPATRARYLRVATAAQPGPDRPIRCRPRRNRARGGARGAPSGW